MKRGMTPYDLKTVPQVRSRHPNPDRALSAITALENSLPGDPESSCSECSGSGRARVTLRFGEPGFTFACDHCDGTGLDWDTHKRLLKDLDLALAYYTFEQHEHYFPLPCYRTD